MVCCGWKYKWKYEANSEVERICYERGFPIILTKDPSIVTILFMNHCLEAWKNIMYICLYFDMLFISKSLARKIHFLDYVHESWLMTDNYIYTIILRNDSMCYVLDMHFIKLLVYRQGIQFHPCVDEQKFSILFKCYSFKRKYYLSCDTFKRPWMGGQPSNLIIAHATRLGHSSYWTLFFTFVFELNKPHNDTW